jgi:N-acetylglucosaminyl-diphospho-decaprenol L-rhamnosyltransferase
MADIGIVIVTFDSEAEIGPCLDSALTSGADIVVVDNASGDDAPRIARERGVQVIENATNRGFAAAVNQGVSLLKTPYVLLLNPDARIESSLDPLRSACDLPRAAGAGGKLLSSGGAPQTGFMARALPTLPALILEAGLLNRIWPGNPVNRRYRGLALDYSRRIQVEQPAGAFLMIRRDVWLLLGGFDESFFPLWFEDVDFCRRAVDRGFVFYFEPAAVARHSGAHSIVRLDLGRRRVYWYSGVVRYAAKHFGWVAFRAVCAAVAAGALVRAAAELSAGRRPAGFGTVLGMALKRLFLGWNRRTQEV